MKRGRADSLVFVGDAVTIPNTRAYCTTTDDETIATAAAKFVGKQRATLQLTRRMLQHVHGYSAMKTKTSLKAGTWLVLPEQKGAKIEGHVVQYLGWDDTRRVQQWRVQTRQGVDLTFTVDAPMLFAGLGWVTARNAKSRVGMQLVTMLGRKAEVVAYKPPGSSLDGRALWKVRHDDDDFEDMEESELVQALRRTGAEVTDSGQPMTVAEIIAAETAAIQKRWKALKSAESPLSLSPIGSSIFPTVSVLDVVSSNDEVVVPPVRIAKVKKLKVSSTDGEAKKVKKLKVSSTDGEAKPRSPTTPRSSRYTGVTWEKRTNKWQAKIYNGVRMKHLGTFPEDMEEAAARAFDEAALELRGAQARLNFPQNAPASAPAPASAKAHVKLPSEATCTSLMETSTATSPPSPLLSSLAGPEDDLITIDDDAGIFDVQDPWCVGV